MILFCNSKGGFCDKIPCDRTCQFYDGSGSKDVRSRADQIRSMTDEELAASWYKHHDDYCHANPACLELSDADKEIPPAWCKRCVLAWLREPADSIKPATMTEEDKLHSGLIEED